VPKNSLCLMFLFFAVIFLVNYNSRKELIFMPKRGTNIYKRKDGRWEARYVKEIMPNGKKKYGSVYAKSYSEVKDKQQYYLFQIKNSNTKKCNISVSELSKMWLKSIENTVKVLTLQKYESIVNNHIEPYFGLFLAKQISVQTINDFSDKKLKDLSASTVNEILVVLGEILNYAEIEYGIAKPHFKMIKENRQEMKVLSISEQKRLENYLMNDIDIYKFGTLLALYTGMRIGELCALNWNDIRDGVITVSKTMYRVTTKDGSKVAIDVPKTNSSLRKIPIPQFLNPVIATKTSTGFVLRTRNGTPVEPRLLQQKFSKYLADCNISGATFHTLRHTFATRCVEAGFDVKSLSEILGHSSVKITLDKYVHSSFEQKQKNMDLLKPASSF
ncbi:MAG: site-specific integrase, partial [Oscillospiraceae bacterium]|nr:site-specific integrase [Oscillospiraceae bacterium]